MTKDSKPTIITDPPGRAVEKHLREHGCLPSEVCYTTMESNILLEALGDDATKWATAFAQHARKIQDRGESVLDEGWLTTWFANAIKHSSDVRRWRREGSSVPSNPKSLQ